MDNNQDKNVQIQSEATEQIQPKQTMKWHKFLIFFSLWVSAAVNAFNAVQLFTGMHYGSAQDARMIYLYFDGLKALDMGIAVVYIGIAVYTIIARFALAQYRADGPKKLTNVYALNMLASIAYPLLIVLVTGLEYSEVMDSSTVRSLIISAGMISYNKKYYKEREYLFVN